LGRRAKTQKPRTNQVVPHDESSSSSEREELAKRKKEAKKPRRKPMVPHDESSSSSEREELAKKKKEAKKPRRKPMVHQNESSSSSEREELAKKKMRKEEKIKKEAERLVRISSRWNPECVTPSILERKIDPRWTVVIDGYNVALNMDETHFNAKCIKMAVEYFEQIGCRTYAVVHDFLLGKYWGKDFTVTKEDLILLKQMRAEEKLYTVPGYAYDDVHIIAAAMEDNGLIVTNDLYRDFKNNQHIKVDMDVLRSRTISFSFVGGKFRKNPEFWCPTYPDDFTDDE